MNKNQEKNLTSTLQQSDLFKGLTIEQLNDIEQYVVARQFAENECLYRQGEIPSGIFLVQSGNVGIVSEIEDGRELLLSYCLPNYWIGFPEIRIQKPAFLTAKAFKASQILFIKAADFQNITKRFPAVLETLVDILSRYHIMSTHALNLYKIKGLEFRLARQCLIMSGNTGFDFGKDSTFRLTATQEELANHVGSSRQSVNKILKKWQEKQKISLEQGAIQFLDPQWLLEIGN